MKKYKTVLDPETGLLRIIALKDFLDVREGNRGGLIEKEHNLSQEGGCWIYESAKVIGDARVWGNALISGKAIVCDNAWVGGNVQVFGHTRIEGDAKVYGSARIFRNAWIYGNAKVCGKACVSGYAYVGGNVKLWSTCPYFTTPKITSTIENSNDYVIFVAKREFNVVSFKNIDENYVEENYIKNIQTIRQIYGEEV